MSERDYPKNHPAAADYDGSPYMPPTAPFSTDYPADHPARGGKNITARDTCDGVRAFVLEQHAANAAITAKSAEPQ